MLFNSGLKLPHRQISNDWMPEDMLLLEPDVSVRPFMKQEGMLHCAFLAGRQLGEGA